MSELMRREEKPLTVLGMQITSITEGMKLAEFFSKSDLVPKDYKGKPGNILVAWQKGSEVGFNPMQSLESIAVINGRTSIWGDGFLALVRGSNKCEYINETLEGTGDNLTAFCETKRKGEAKTVKRSFSVKQAKQAGLWGNNTWAKYPERMLQMRARGFCLRDAYPDLLNGIQLAEEQLDAENNIANPGNATYEQLSSAIAGLGMKSENRDGRCFIVSGDTFNNAKTLKELGFTISDGVWSAAYKQEEPISDAEIEETETTEEVPQIDIPKIETEEQLASFVQSLGLELVVKPNGQGIKWGRISGDVDKKSMSILEIIGFSTKNGMVLRNLEDLQTAESQQQPEDEDNPF